MSCFEYILYNCLCIKNGKIEKIIQFTQKIFQFQILFLYTIFSFKYIYFLI